MQVVQIQSRLPQYAQRGSSFILINANWKCRTLKPLYNARKYELATVLSMFALTHCTEDELQYHGA